MEISKFDKELAKSHGLLEPFLAWKRNNRPAATYLTFIGTLDVATEGAGGARKSLVDSLGVEGAEELMDRYVSFY